MTIPTEVVEQLKAFEIATVAWCRERKEFVEVVVTPTVIECEDGNIWVSAEDGKYLADYYGEVTGGYPYINEHLEKFAKDRGMFWEWQDPGTISLHYV